MKYIDTISPFTTKEKALVRINDLDRLYKRKFPNQNVVMKLLKKGDVYIVEVIKDFDEFESKILDEQVVVSKENNKISKTYKSKNTLINKLTIRSIEELLSHESIVREAYKDSKGIWTWSVGITKASGHEVYPKYKDNPQTLKYCLEVFEWLVRTVYLPKVEEVFKGFDLTEEQIAAALSFHYNTGKLHIASWAKEWKKGETDKAYKSFMHWKTPRSILKRREKERELFFNGKWSSNGEITEFKVKKPSYTPDWSSGKTVDIKSILKELFE